MLTRKNTTLPPSRGMIDVINTSGTQGRVAVNFSQQENNRFLVLRSFKAMYKNTRGSGAPDTRVFPPSLNIKLNPFLQAAYPGHISLFATDIEADINTHYQDLQNSLTIIGRYQLTNTGINQTRFRLNRLDQYQWSRPFNSPLTLASNNPETLVFAISQGTISGSDSNYFFEPVRKEPSILFDYGENRRTAAGNYPVPNIALGLMSYILKQEPTQSEMKITDKYNVWYYKSMKTPNIFPTGLIPAAPLPLALPNGAPSVARRVTKNFLINLQWCAKPVETIYGVPLTKTEEMYAALWVDRESRLPIDSKISPNVFHPALTAS